MKNIVLIGFMGTGKTSTGKLLSGRLDMPLIDVDEKIEAETGISISRIFQQYGEAYFRNLEREAIAKLAQGENTIIATGGGAVLDPLNLIRLKETGIVISLMASIDVILERTGRRNNRPLLEVEDRIKQVTRLFFQRVEFYKNADLIVDTSLLTPAEVTGKVIVFLQRGGYFRGTGQG